MSSMQFDEWYVKEFGRQPNPAGYETEIAHRAWQAARTQAGMNIGKAAGQLGDRLMQEHGVFLTPDTLRSLVAGMLSHVPAGGVTLAGDITDEDGTTFRRALLIQFPDDDSLRAAIQSGQCRFTVFGGEV